MAADIRRKRSNKRASSLGEGVLFWKQSARVQVMAPNRKIYALKRIKLQGRDREAATGFIDEITLLRKLKGHTNIIQLIDAEARRLLTCPAPFLLHYHTWLGPGGAPGSAGADARSDLLGRACR